jgi:hypothetical protein
MVPGSRDDHLVQVSATLAYTSREQSCLSGKGVAKILRESTAPLMPTVFACHQHTTPHRTSLGAEVEGRGGEDWSARHLGTGTVPTRAHPKPTGCSKLAAVCYLDDRPRLRELPEVLRTLRGTSRKGGTSANAQRNTCHGAWLAACFCPISESKTAAASIINDCCHDSKRGASSQPQGSFALREFRRRILDKNQFSGPDSLVTWTVHSRGYGWAERTNRIGGGFLP